MNTATTILIVPAWSDQAGQCRIVARDHNDEYTDGHPMHMGLRDYRAMPHLWKEVGLMASDGRLVCFSGKMAELTELTEAQPLAAGMVFRFSKVVA